jgi:hypothetical protein
MEVAGTQIVSVPAVFIAALATVGACVKLTTPPADIAIASVSDADPIVPASPITSEDKVPTEVMPV